MNIDNIMIEFKANYQAQIMGLIALILISLSYQCKTKKNFLFTQIFSNIFFALQYFLLHAYSAFCSNIVSITRTIIFYIYTKRKKEIPIYFPIFIISTIIIIGIITYKDLYSIIPIIIAISYTIATYQKNLKITYIISIITCLLWIIYNKEVNAYIGIISSIIELIASSIGLFRIRGKNERISKRNKRNNRKQRIR